MVILVAVGAEAVVAALEEALAAVALVVALAEAVGLVEGFSCE